MGAVAIKQAFPTARDPFPIHPCRIRKHSLTRPLRRIKRRLIIPPPFPPRVANKLAQATREGPEIRFIYIPWHHPREDSASRNHCGGMRAEQDSDIFCS